MTRWSCTIPDNRVRRAQQDDIPMIMELLVQVDMVHHNGRPDLFKGPIRSLHRRRRRPHRHQDQRQRQGREAPQRRRRHHAGHRRSAVRASGALRLTQVLAAPRLRNRSTQCPTRLRVARRQAVRSVRECAEDTRACDSSREMASTRSPSSSTSGGCANGPARLHVARRQAARSARECAIGGPARLCGSRVAYYRFHNSEASASEFFCVTGRVRAPAAVVSETVP